MMTTPLAQQLWQARINGTQVADQAYPPTIEDAYRVQREIDQICGCTINGYKIGATVPATMALLGVDSPFFGPLYDEHTHSGNSTLRLHKSHSVQVETEFVVGLATDIKATDVDLTITDIAQATAWIAGGFEFIGTRFAHNPDKRGLCAIADSGSNVAMVVGQPYAEWQSLDLNESPVTLSINDEQMASGDSGMSIAGNPLGMVAWLINHPLMRSRGLLAGEIVTCGTCTGVLPVKSGDQLQADFGAVGGLSCTVEIS